MPTDAYPSERTLLCFSRETLAFDYLKRVCRHFEASPELSAASVLHIELLLQRGKELLGKQKIEDIITGTFWRHCLSLKNGQCTHSSEPSLGLPYEWWIVLFSPVLGHYTGKPLTPQSLVSLHLLLWDKAAKYFEVNWTSLSTFKPSILNSQLRNTSSPCQAKNYVEALQWYNYSLSFYKAGQMEPNLAKLQRNRASCFLLLKQLDKVMGQWDTKQARKSTFPQLV